MISLHFAYDEEKDIDCLLSKGGGSMNSSKPTKTYQRLLQEVTDSSDREAVRIFVRSAREKDVNESVHQLQSSWDAIATVYEKRSETMFGVPLDASITAFLTIAGRYPYNIKQHYFFIPISASDANAICMHELWHFYTWKRFGSEQEKIGAEKYNELKESLTVLLNTEFADLLDSKTDSGYPEHQSLRDHILEIWNQTKDMQTVWDAGIAFLD